MLQRRALWLTPFAVATAIACAPKNNGLPNAPIFNTGARATVIMPGQNAPAMPGQNNAGPSGTAQVPYGAPPSGGAYLGGPGAPPPGTPPSQWGNPNDLSMLGGAVTVDTQKIKKPRNPLNNNPVLWPLAFIAWPFEKLAQAASGEDEGDMLDRRAQAIVDGHGRIPPSGQQQAQAAYDQAQNDAMERELAARNGGAAPGASGAPAPGPSYASAAPSRSGASIASELEALRNRAKSTPQQARAARVRGRPDS